MKYAKSFLVAVVWLLAACALFAGLMWLIASMAWWVFALAVILGLVWTEVHEAMYG